MTAFNYLRAQPALPIAACLDQWKMPLLVGIACAAVLGGTYGIERRQLSDALATEQRYQLRMDASERALDIAKRRYHATETLLRMQADAANIVRSARMNAQLFFALADAIPQHVWLTAVRRDDTGMILQGRARSLDGIAQCITALERTPMFARPALTSASRLDDAKQRSILFEVHVDVTGHPL